MENLQMAGKMAGLVFVITSMTVLLIAVTAFRRAASQVGAVSGQVTGAGLGLGRARS